MKMSIVRNGQKIFLTEDEIYKAFEVQKFEFARENISENMHLYLNEEELALYENDQNFINEAAASFQNLEDKGFSYEYAVETACRNTVKRYSKDEPEEER